MEQMVPTDTATYKEFIGKSIIDLIFIIDILSEILNSCGIIEEFDHDFDHLLILS